MVIDLLRKALTEPEVNGVDPDSPAFTRGHRAVLARKRLVRNLFSRFYTRCREADERYFRGCAASRRLELGSGAGVFKDVFPDVFTSDVKNLPYVDLVARGEELPFADHAFRAIYALNVFHHVPDARAFFGEMTRVIAPGGGLVMIEPYYGPVARFVFKNLFTMESYNTAELDWPRHARNEVASAANQALSYIVFRRDLAKWNHEFPELELVADHPHTHVGYLASGGVNFRQLVPDLFGDALLELEERLPLVNPLLALQHTLVVRRRIS